MGGQTIHYTVGLYPDGRPGEVFIDMSKCGTMLRAWAGATAKLMSLMLQYGIPLHVVVQSMEGWNTEAFTAVPVVGHESISESTGALDFIVRALAADFGGHDDPDFEHTAEYDGKLLDLLALVLKKVVNGGVWQDRADAVRLAMMDRDAYAELETFSEWFCE